MLVNRIVRIATTALAVLALTGAVFHGDRLSIHFPSDWTIEAPDKDGLVVANEPGGGANCNVQTVDLADLVNSSLDELNAEYGHVFDVAEWADLLGEDPENITLVLSDMSPFADTFYHTATFSVDIDATREATVRYGFYVLPGRISMTGCYALSGDYPTYKSTFELIVDSFRPS